MIHAPPEIRPPIKMQELGSGSIDRMDLMITMTISIRGNVDRGDSIKAWRKTIERTSKSGHWLLIEDIIHLRHGRAPKDMASGNLCVGPVVRPKQNDQCCLEKLKHNQRDSAKSDESSE